MTEMPPRPRREKKQRMKEGGMRSRAAENDMLERGGVEWLFLIKNP